MDVHVICLTHVVLKIGLYLRQDRLIVVFHLVWYQR